MFIAAASCSFKCDNEYGCQICQNSHLATCPAIEISYEEVIERYRDNPLTSAIVWGGLEPMDQFEELYVFISLLREKYHINDDVIIYTGYKKYEIDTEVVLLSTFPNIIIKYGRYIPTQPPIWDEVLGVELASPNQYAERIS